MAVGEARHLRSDPVRPLRHPVDQNLAGSFALSVLFVSLAIVTGLPLVVGLSLLLPLALALQHACAWACRAGRGGTVSAFDAFWLHRLHHRHPDPDSEAPCCEEDEALLGGDPLRPAYYQHQYVGHAVLLLESPGLTLQALRDLVRTRLVDRTLQGERAFPRFRQRALPLPWGGYCWRDDPQFVLERHVVQDSRRLASRRQMRLYVQQCMQRPLCPRRPLWQVRMVAYRGGCTALLVRVHHALSDGVTMVKVLCNALADTSHQLRLKPRFGGATFPLNVFRALVTGPLTFVGWLLWPRADFNLFRHWQPLSGMRAVAWSRPLRFAKVQRVKQITRSSVNDVLATALAGALRAYCRRNGVRRPPNVTISLPVDLRYEPSNPETAPELGNGYSLVNCELPTSAEGSIPRLWEVRHCMEELKTSADPVVMYGAVNYLGTLLPEGLAQWLIGRVQRKPSVAFCNLPGPEEQLVLGGQRVSQLLVWMAPRPEIPLTFTVCSYAGHLFLTVAADRNAVPDPRAMVNEFVAQLDRLSRLLSKRRIPGEHRRRSSFTAERRQEEIFKPTIQEIQQRLHRVQDELHEITQRLEVASHPELFGGVALVATPESTKTLLCRRVEELKEEFSELLTELRRRKSAADPSFMMDDDDLEGELRRPAGRRRTLSASSSGRRSSLTSVTPLMSTSRPLTTPTTSQRSAGVRRGSLLLDSSPDHPQDSLLQHNNHLQPTHRSQHNRRHSDSYGRPC